jgi:hypothetical protein
VISFSMTVAAFEVWGRYIDSIRGQLKVEQLGQHPTVTPDELRIHAGDVHLAQVHARDLTLARSASPVN